MRVRVRCLCWRGEGFVSAEGFKDMLNSECCFVRQQDDGDVPYLGIYIFFTLLVWALELYIDLRQAINSRKYS